MTETEPPSLPIDAQASGIAGFWRRVLAFSIDVLLLGMIGFILGLFFFDQFARLGAWGRLIGFFVCLLYFGCMNSALAGGKTLGKRLLKIQVVDVEDKSICLPRSCVRFVILALP